MYLHAFVWVLAGCSPTAPAAHTLTPPVDSAADTDSPTDSESPDALRAGAASASSSSGASSVTMTNTAPVIRSVSLTPRQADDDDVLQVAVDARDPDGDSLTTTVEWYRDGVSVPEAGPWTTFDPALTGEGEQWSAVVTVSDGVLTASATSDAVTIQASERTWVYQEIDLRIAPDGMGGWVGLDGQLHTIVESEGWPWSPVLCDERYVLTSAAPVSCRGCDWAFDTSVTWDAASTASTTPAVCAGMQVDGDATPELSGLFLDFPWSGPEVWGYTSDGGVEPMGSLETYFYAGYDYLRYDGDASYWNGAIGVGSDGYQELHAVHWFLSPAG